MPRRAARRARRRGHHRAAPGRRLCLAGHGRPRSHPQLIDSVQDRDGQVLWRPEGIACQGCDNKAAPPDTVDQRKQIADPASVFQVVTMMQGVMQRGTGAAGRRRAEPQPRRQDRHHQRLQRCLVRRLQPGSGDRRVGRLRRSHQSLGNNEFGAQVAGPIWHDYMASALRNRPSLPFPAPPGVTLATWDSGFGQVTDAFKPGQAARRLRPGRRRWHGQRARRDPSPTTGTAAARRRSRQWPGRVVLAPPFADRLEHPGIPMSAESDALNEQIKQSIALLRRHL